MFRYTLNVESFIDLPGMAYIPIEPGAASVALERYLPPCPNGVMAAWLKKNIDAGSWVVDVLGSTPLTAIQAAQCGYRVLTARSNPLVRFMLEVLASAPTENNFRLALNTLLRTKVGAETLAHHLQGLYETRCPSCNQLTQAQGYVWEKYGQQPKLRLVDCANCGQKGELPLGEADLECLARIEAQKKKTRARAKQRVMLGLKEGAYGLEDALSCYADRPLYFLMTFINKLDGMTRDEGPRRLLRALILSLMDAGSNLWHWPPKNERPLSLNTPAEFLEHNLWDELQSALKFWTILDSPVTVTRWPELPPDGGGICLYLRSAANLKEIASFVKPQAALVNFPRPNQAWMTLTVLWSGWLWGVKAIEHLRRSLKNRRYDWRWLAGTHQLALRQVNHLLSEGRPVFGILNDSSPSYLFAVLTAARSCQLSLKGIALRQARHITQFEWRYDPKQEAESKSPDFQDYARMMREAMRMKGEPLSSEEVMTICRIQHALMEKLPANLLEMDDNLLDEHLSRIKSALQNSGLFTIYKNANIPGGSQWWPTQSIDSEIPLSDRLENSISILLQKGQPVHTQEVNRYICGEFPGLFVPSMEGIQICLESYAAPLPGQTDGWILRKEDEPVQRAAEINKAIQALKFLGVKVGCRIEGENPLTWLEKNGQVMHRFHLIGNGIISPFMSEPQAARAGQNVLIFPASRSRLILYKLKNNAAWQTQVENNWQLVKMRHLQKMASQADFNRALWEVQLNADPPAWDAPMQMQIL